ncbi:hypothetical protein HK096_005762 [Nowakowskiella sp. JEL0078]|nr:hypothetical protein HK096_005762 [Nowakowskiella sp. JEL0078]
MESASTFSLESIVRSLLEKYESFDAGWMKLSLYLSDPKNVLDDLVTIDTNDNVTSILKKLRLSQTHIEFAKKILIKNREISEEIKNYKILSKFVYQTPENLQKAIEYDERLETEIIQSQLPEFKAAFSELGFDEWNGPVTSKLRSYMLDSWERYTRRISKEQAISFETLRLKEINDENFRYAEFDKKLTESNLTVNIGSSRRKKYGQKGGDLAEIAKIEINHLIAAKKTKDERQADISGRVRELLKEKDIEVPDIPYLIKNSDFLKYINDSEGNLDALAIAESRACIVAKLFLKYEISINQLASDSELNRFYQQYVSQDHIEKYIQDSMYWKDKSQIERQSHLELTMLEKHGMTITKEHLDINECKLFIYKANCDINFVVKMLAELYWIETHTKYLNFRKSKINDIYINLTMFRPLKAGIFPSGLDSDRAILKYDDRLSACWAFEIWIETRLSNGIFQQSSLDDVSIRPPEKLATVLDSMIAEKIMYLVQSEIFQFIYQWRQSGINTKENDILENFCAYLDQQYKRKDDHYMLFSETISMDCKKDIGEQLAKFNCES